MLRKIPPAIMVLMIMLLFFWSSSEASVEKIYTVEIWKFKSLDAAEKVMVDFSDWLGPENNEELRIERINNNYSVRIGAIKNRRYGDKLLERVQEKFHAAVLLKTDMNEARVQKRYTIPIGAEKHPQPETSSSAQASLLGQPETEPIDAAASAEMLVSLFGSLLSTTLPTPPPDKIKAPDEKITSATELLLAQEAAPAEESVPVEKLAQKSPGSDPPPPLAAAPTPDAESPSASAGFTPFPELIFDANEYITIQVGSYTRLRDAQKAYSDLEWLLTSTQCSYLRIEMVQGFHTVRLGRFVTVESASQLLSAVNEKFLKAIILKAYIKEERVVRIYPIPTYTEDTDNTG